MREHFFELGKFDRKELLSIASDYLVVNYYQELWNAMTCDEIHVWMSLLLDGLKLFAHSQLLGNLLLIKSRETMALFDEAVLVAQNEILLRFPNEKIQIHPRIVVRWHHLPNFAEVYRPTLPKSIDANKLVTVRGTIVRAQQPKVIEWEVLYQCESCRGTFSVQADLESYSLHPFPRACRAVRPTQVGAAKKCTGRKFVKISSLSAANARDYQELKLQEQVQHLNMGALPRSMVVVVIDGMVGACNPGDDVSVTGLITHRWGVLSFGEKPELELMLLASSVTVNNDRKSTGGTAASLDEASKEFQDFWREHSDTPLLARDAIIRSICPEVYGLYNVKLALATVLAGGVRLQRGMNTTRGDAHLLLIGDPGTGKSQLLRFAAKITTRSVLTTGVGTTGAGLTAAAVKEPGGEYALEAGALVLADGGICCIDELSSIRKDDQTSVHEAMEQQTLHIAKAGIVCELQTRCSVLAATNPKAKYNVDESISMNVALGGALLSRFDLVLVMLDEPDEEWDKAVSNFILKERTRGVHQTEAIGTEDPPGADDDIAQLFHLAAANGHGTPNNHHKNTHTSPPSRSSSAQLIQSGHRPYSIPNSPMPNRSSIDSPFIDDAASSNGSQAMGLENSSFTRSGGVGASSLLTSVWPIAKLQAYFSWIKSNFKPKLTDDVILIGTTYYSRQRQADIPDAARTTTRLAEAFIRITQGHAKLMARHHCIVQDAIFAVLLMESSTFTSAIGGQRIPTVRSFFSSDPDAEYYKIEQMVLQHLGLQHLASRPPTDAGGPRPLTPNPARSAVTGYNNTSTSTPINTRTYFGAPHNNSHTPTNQPALPTNQSPRTSSTTISPQVETRTWGATRPQGPLMAIPMELDTSASMTASQFGMDVDEPHILPTTNKNHVQHNRTVEMNNNTTPMMNHQSPTSRDLPTASSQGPLSHTIDAELIPLPPSQDGEFGVWNMPSERPLQLSIQQSVTVDLDEDFMM